jgi:hypothetical protein
MLTLILALQVAGAPATARVPLGPRDTLPFARLVEQLSESGGYFDTDNLISNESSYLHVLGTIRAEGLQGGAYLGVGPDQNFSYIAAVRPQVAFIVDLRRDNLLLHLLYKAVFETARNRLEFLGLLFGRPVPAELRPWDERPLADLLNYIEETPADPARHARTHAQLAERIRSYGFSPAAVDFATIRRFHDEFMQAGLELRFTTYGRGPRTYYPTIGQLYRERDVGGREASFLAREESFRFLQRLERQGRIIPVVGDFGGTRAFRAIGRFLAERKLEVSLFYTSNVEFYLFRQGAFRRYVDNVRALPWAKNALITRSYFGGVMGQPHPQARPGYASAQLLQTAASFRRMTAEPDSVSYWELVTTDALELRP